MALIMRSRHTHTTVVALALLLLCLPVASGEYDRHTLRGSRALGSMGHGAGLKKCRPWMGWNCPPVAGERGPLRDEDGGRVQAGRGHEADANVEVEGQDDQALVVEERQQQVPVVEEDVGKWQLDSQDVTGRSSSVFADGNYDRDIESVAKFWNSRPCNAGWKFPGVEFGTLDWFEKVRTKKFIVEPHIPSFAEFPKWNGKNVLIIGGGLCTNAASFLEAGARVTVIDLSSESFKLCQKNLELRGLTANADLYNGNAEELQAVIPPQKFDLIWSFGVIHHSPRPSVIMEQCRAFMKVGTEVRIMVYSKISFKLFEVLAANDKNLNLGEGDKLIEQYSEAQAGSPVTFTYTKNEAAALVAKSGATVTSVWKDHIFPYNITHYQKNEYKVVDYLEHLHGTPAFDELEADLGWHTMIKGVVLPEMA